MKALRLYCQMVLKILQNEIGKLGRNFPLATFGSERVKKNKRKKQKKKTQLQKETLYTSHFL